MNKLALAALVLAVPLTARAEVGLRLGGEASIGYHAGYPAPTGKPLATINGTHFLTDDWPEAANVMISYWLPTSILVFDLELAEQFLASGPASGRVGTVLRPGVRLSLPILPVYLRGAIPINVETANLDRETFDLRLGAGVNIPLALFKIYLEADADFSLGGGSHAPSPFQNWNILVSSGLDYRF
jgi:hypothetical protein